MYFKLVLSFASVLVVPALQVKGLILLSRKSKGGAPSVTALTH